MTEENIRKIIDDPRSITMKMGKSFNDLFGYYRNDIPNLVDLLYPLTELNKKGSIKYNNKESRP